MKKRILCILLTMCMVMCLTPTAAFAATTATVDSTAKEAYDNLVKQGVLPNDIPFDNFIDVSQHQKGTDIVIDKDGTYFITGSVTFSGKDPARIRVDDKVTGAVAFFYNCYMDYSQCKDTYSPVTVHAGAYATLHFLGENTFIGAKKRPGIEKNYKKGGGIMTLKLWDDCSVTATGGEFAAGIGSAYEKDGGGILIETNGSKGNGKLIANGTNGVYDKDEEGNNIYIGGAGIGGSKDGSAHNITIAGGTIIANGGKESAGIGGGYNGNAEDIWISGGTIEATSPGGGAGIGTGSCSSQRAEKENWLVCRNVTITGGDVTATGGRMHTAGIGGGAGGKAENISIKGGSVTALVKSSYYGRVIGGGQDCTDISESITASLSAFSDKGKYYMVTLIATDKYAGNVEQIKYRIYPGETFDIQEIIENWFNTGRKEGENCTLIPGITFTLVNCSHFELITEGETSYLQSTDYYKTVGEDRVRFCDQCGSVLDYDNTNPEFDSEYSKNVVGDWNFKLIDPQPTTTELKTVSYTNPNGNTIDFIVTEKPSGIYEVQLDGETLKANKDGSYTVPADSALPDSVNKHTLYFIDRAGHSVTCDNIRVFEAITITAYCDGNPMFINDTGNFEVQMAKGGIFKLTDIKKPGYNGYYKVYANGEYFGTVLKTGDLGRFYEDTRLDFYTDTDREPPTGKITVAENNWTDFDSEGRTDTEVFINKDEKVTVAAADGQSGVETVKYFVSAASLNKSQLENKTDWLDYTEPFELPTDKAYYVYVKITDKTGNITYINSAAIKAITKPVEIVSVSGNPTEWQADSAEIKLTATGDAPVKAASVYIDGSVAGKSCTVNNNQITFTAERNGSYRVVVTDSAGNTAERTVEVTQIDKSVPTVTLTADEDTPRRSASVTIDVTECVSGYKLYLSYNGNPEHELLEKSFTVTENGTYTVRAINGAGTEHKTSVSYTNIDTETPMIDGIEDGKVYCGSVTFRVKNERNVKVTADGKALLPGSDGVYTVAPADAMQTVTVTDEAGNTVLLSITVNSGHTWSNWAHGDNTHIRKCTVDGCSGTETESCSGGKANCTDKAVCEVCNASYGDLKPHSYSPDWQADETNHWHECTECGAKADESEHTDTNKNHMCDVCEKVLSKCADNDKDHKCDLCGKTLSEHTGGTATCVDKATCEVCGAHYGAVAASNHTGGTEVRDAKAATCTADGYTGDTYCKGCDALLTNGKAISATGHTGGTATCKDKAVCEICGESYGELDSNNHADMKHIEAKAATKTAEGNIEYWYCEGCGKYFADKNGNKEITKADTVTAKLPDDSQSPQTGDNSNLMLWIALLFISGGAVTVTTVVSKKKRHS